MKLDNFKLKSYGIFKVKLDNLSQKIDLKCFQCEIRHLNFEIRFKEIFK